MCVWLVVGVVFSVLIKNKSAKTYTKYTQWWTKFMFSFKRLQDAEFS